MPMGFEEAQLHWHDRHLPEGFTSAEPPARGKRLTMDILMADGRVGTLDAANATLVWRDARLSEFDQRRGTICAAPVMGSSEQWIRIDGPYKITVHTEEN